MNFQLDRGPAHKSDLRQFISHLPELAKNQKIKNWTAAFFVPLPRLNMILYFVFRPDPVELLPRHILMEIKLAFLFFFRNFSQFPRLLPSGFFCDFLNVSNKICLNLKLTQVRLDFFFGRGEKAILN